MKLFQLVMAKDKSGVPSTVTVADGVVFSDGKCAVNWLTRYSSIAIYEDLETLEAIIRHMGKTKVVMLASTERRHPMHCSICGWVRCGCKRCSQCKRVSRSRHYLIQGVCPMCMIRIEA